jgi:hypothetical protein
MCKGGGPPNCSDGNDCTDDWCDDKVGCVYNVQSGACDDQNACTLDDQCTQGACGYGKLLACNDGNPCTDDACDPASGCVHVHNAAPCSDGDACTMDDTCQDGNCVPGKPFSCDDGEPCTAQSCDPETGCVFTPITVPVPTALSNSPECEGGVLLLAASGAEGVGWLWTGPDGFTSTEQNPALQGITPLAAGTYSVQAVIGECASEAVTVEVTVIPAPHGTKTFAYTGAAQAFAVPICITSITVDAYGAEGGASAYSQSTGGKGGRVQAVLTVTPGKSLQVVVGGKPGGQNGGYNGGGVGTLTGTGWPPLFYGGGGGGASDLRTGQFSLAERILVAGGGGGAGRDGSYPGCNGGAGGGETGGSGSKASDSAAVGTGGSQTEGGVAGGTLGEGGDGVAAQGGGGDGGGYYGGGGGARAGGGGGSSFAAPDSKDVVHTQGARAGNGEVKLTW